MFEFILLHLPDVIPDYLLGSWSLFTEHSRPLLSYVQRSLNLIEFVNLVPTFYQIFIFDGVKDNYYSVTWRFVLHFLSIASFIQCLQL